MVVLQRSELRRIRLIYFFAIVLSVATLAVAVAQFSTSAGGVRLALGGAALVAVATIAVCAIQLAAYPERSHALLIHLGDYMIIATNSLHESFKLRYLRDILTDSVSVLSDEDRTRWKSLEADGYHLALRIQNPRKILILRLCTMVFDDVFVIDRSNRWERHDSSSTADPTFSSREMPTFRTWNGAL